MDNNLIFPAMGWWLVRFWLVIGLGSLVSPVILFFPSLLMLKNGRSHVYTRLALLLVVGTTLSGSMLWLVVNQPQFMKSLALFTEAVIFALVMLPLAEYVVQKRAWAIATMAILVVVIVVLVVVAVITAIPLL